MNRHLTASLIGLAAFLLALGAGTLAQAQDKPACEQFDWSVSREQALFGSAALKKAAPGAVLDGPGGIALELNPNASVSFVLPPGRQPKSTESFGGVLTVTNLAGGTYQVTLSSEAWIDVIQAGRSLQSAAHSVKRGCPDVRKSVRFTLNAGTAIVQISGAAANVINVAVLPAE